MGNMNWMFWLDVTNVVLGIGVLGYLAHIVISVCRDIAGRKQVSQPLVQSDMVERKVA